MTTTYEMDDVNSIEYDAWNGFYEIDMMNGSSFRVYEKDLSEEDVKGLATIDGYSDREDVFKRMMEVASRSYDWEMRTWQNGKSKIVEIDFDHDLHAFEVYRDDRLIGTVTPGSIDDMFACIDSLDNGEDPVEAGWEDGMGNTLVDKED